MQSIATDPYKMEIFPVGILYSLQKLKNHYRPDSSPPVATLIPSWEIQSIEHCLPPEVSRFGRSDFFTLRLYSCYKIFLSGSGSVFLHIWESDSFSDSNYHHWSSRNLPMFLLEKWSHRLLPLPKLKSGSGSVFLQMFDSGSGTGSERKTKNPAGVDFSTPDPW